MIRIPVFNKNFLFNIGKEPQVINDKINEKWISGQWKAERPMSNKQVGISSIAKEELFRMLKYKTCPFCKKEMIDILNREKYGESLFVCKNCLYWGGRGSREEPCAPYLNRGVLGRIDFINNVDEMKLEQIIVYLNNNIEKLYELTPQEAEKLMPYILRDYLDCEVLAFGGVKDKGIDALAIHGNGIKTIIQIKWRKNCNKAESVSVVREVGGTLLARKIPNGLIVTTSKKFSKDAILEADKISENEVLGMGKLNLELNEFNNLIDMFEISTKIRTDNMTLEDFTGINRCDIFDVVVL